MLQTQSALDNFWVSCWWVGESPCLSATLVYLDSVQREHSHITLDPEAVWLSGCSNHLGSVSGLSVLLCCPSNEVDDTDEWAEVLCIYVG